MHQGVDETVVDDIESAVMDLRHAGSTVVRVSRLPYVVPVVEYGVQDPDYVLAEADRTGADITLRVDGVLCSETVDGGGYPVHKANSAETAGYGDPQPRAEEAAHKNVRAVADRLTELLDDTGIDALFVVGEVQSRSDLLAALPKRVSEHAMVLPGGARHSGYDLNQVQQAIEEAFQHRRLTELDDAVQRYVAEAGRQSGLAADGLGPVCAALSQGAVETLIVGDLGDATVVADEDLAVAAPDADVLSEYGAAPAHTLRTD